jgi:hypothetical protein
MRHFGRSALARQGLPAQSASAALGRCGTGRAARIVYEGKRGHCRNKAARRADRGRSTRILRVCPSSDPYLAPGTILNPLIDALEAALAPSATTGIQNLGLPEMVQHAYIAGKVETGEGVLGDQAIAIVPVEVLCI